MPISLRLAWRNLWRHKRRTWLTTGAMVFSNVLLVFLITWQYAMYGMMVDNSLRMLTGHFQIQHPAYFDKPRIENSFQLSKSTLEALENQDGIDVLVRRSEAFVLASSRERSYGIQIIGVEANKEASISSLPGLLKDGRYLQANEEQIEIVLGSRLAKNLKIKLGDELTLFGSAKDGSTAAAIATLVGTLETGVQEVDRNLAFIHLEDFDAIFAMEGEIHRVVALTPSVDSVDTLLTKIPELGEDVVVRDWNKLLPELKQSIQSDMASSWFMYSVLIILVAFSVLNTQLMSVLERTKEYGIMMALGLNTLRLASLVLLEALLMALLGLLLGIGLGLIVVAILGQTGVSFPGMEEMAAEFNIPSRMYLEIDLRSAMAGPLLVFSASILAAIYPVLRLRRLRIVQAMRAP